MLRFFILQRAGHSPVSTKGRETRIAVSFVKTNEDPSSGPRTINFHGPDSIDEDRESSPPQPHRRVTRVSSVREIYSVHERHRRRRPSKVIRHWFARSCEPVTEPPHMPGAYGISILLYEKRSSIVHHAEVDDERRSVEKKAMIRK